jgi:uncharacterized membrane protein
LLDGGVTAVAIEGKDTARLEAFSDGVFAVAITLLALDLQVPHLPPDAGSSVLAHALLSGWPSYVAFVTSFFTVLVMWVNHHGLFKLVQTASVRVLFANGFLLMIVTAVPFSTSLVTHYLKLPAATAACAAYAGTFVLISLGYTWLWYSITHDAGVLRADAPEETVRRITRNYCYGPPLYILATVAAFFSPYLMIGICTALWVFWALTAKAF